MRAPEMPRDWWRRRLPEGMPRPRLELYESTLEERHAATRELVNAEAVVDQCAQAYAVTGREEILGLLVAAMRQHRAASEEYLRAFALTHADPPP